jgi:hypothetical protein
MLPQSQADAAEPVLPGEGKRFYVKKQAFSVEA